MAFDAEDWLDSLDALGMRFGLERMHKLVTALGMPQHRFASVHVVGTNGKSSVTEMASALIGAHGHRCGAYLSPHLERWAERVTVAGEPIAEEAFAAAAERTAEAVRTIERTLEPGDAVSQFEAATAAAFVALATARVEFAVIEAGLGGRLDATNVLPSKATVLTSIGLEHTEWLGDTVEEIAAEKLAVLRDHTTLVAGTLPPAVERIARETAAARHCRYVAAGDQRAPAGLDRRAPYLRRNLAVALAAAETAVGELDPGAVDDSVVALDLRGRMETVGSDPPLMLDAAHNPDGARALAEAIAATAAGRPAFAALAVLADKDVEGIVGALAPACAGMVATEIPAQRLAHAGRPGARPMPAGRIAAAARAAGLDPVHEVRDPGEAVARVRELARAGGGIAVLAGSHYLLGYAGA